MNRKNESGSTLILVVVFATLSMIALSSMNTAVLKQTEQFRSANFRSDFNEFLDQLESALNSPQACTNIMNNLTLTDRRNIGINDPVLNASNITLINPLGTGNISRGVFPIPNDQSFRISDVSVQLGARGIDMGGPAPNTYYRSFSAKLIVSALECNSMNQNCNNLNRGSFITNRVKPASGAGRRPRQYHEIDLIAYVDQNNIIQTCFGLNSVGSSCQTTGGVWNPNEADPRFRCMPYRTCRTLPNGAGESLRRAPNITGATCSNFRFDPIVVGTNPNTGLVSYICEWCNDNNYNTTFYTTR